MAIKVEFVTEHSKWLDGMRKIQDSVKTTTKTITDSFDAQAAAVEKLSKEMEELAAEIDKAEGAGDAKTVEEKRRAYEELGKELEKEKKAFEEMNTAFGKMGGGGGGGQSAESMRTRMRMLNMEIAELTMKYRAMSDAEKQSASGQALQKKINELTDEAGNLRDVMGDVARAVSGVASDTRGFDQLAGALNVATSAAGAYTGVLTMFGAKQEELVEIQTKLQASLAISNGLSQIQNNIQKESAVMLGIRSIQEKALSAGIALRTAAEGKGVIATKAATVAQKAFNLVAKANPYVLLATAILTVVGAFWAFSKGSKKAAEEEKRLKEESEKTAAAQKKMADTIGGAVGDVMGKYKSLQVEWRNLSSEHEKIQWVKNNQQAFHQLGLSVNGVTDAEQVLVNMAPQVIAALKAVAEAEAYQQLYMEAIKDKAQNWERRQRSKATGDYYTPVGKGDKKQYTFPKEWQDAGLKEGVDYTSSMSYVQGQSKIVYTLGKSGEQRLNAARHSKAVELRHQSERPYDDAISAYEKGWEEAMQKADFAKSKIPQRYQYTGGGSSGGRSGSGKSGGKGSQWDAAKEEADRLQMYDKWKEELLKTAFEESERYTDAYIEDMKESTEKALYEIDQQEGKALKEIEERRKKLIEDARQLDIDMWKKSAPGRDEYNYQDKSEEDYIAMIEEETPDLLATLDSQAEQISAHFKKQRDELLKQEAEAEAEKWREYEMQYGNYQQQRLAIEEKYNKMIADSTSDAEKAILSQQMEGELDDLDNRIMDSSKLWSEYFGKFESRSNSAIRGVMKDILELIDYMNGVEGAEVPDIFAKNEDTLKAIQAAMQDPKAIKAFTDNLKKTWETFKKMLDADNPFKLIANGFKKGGSNEDMAKGFKQIADAMNQVQSLMSQIGISADSTAGKITSTIGNTASLAAQGAQIGGVYGAAAGAALGIAQGLVGAFGADYSQYQKLVEEYSNLIGVWDELIAKKKEYISESYGAEAIKASKEAESLVQKEVEAWRILGRERLNAGASAGSHSIGVRIRQKMTAADWRGVGYDLGGRLEGLFDLSAQQLEELKESAPTFWAKLDDDVRKYLQNIIDGAEKLEEIEELQRKQLTATTFDSVYDSFMDSLSDMDKSAYDFSKDFEKYMFNAVLNAQVGNLFKKRLEDWYKAFADKMEGGLTDSEIASLRAEYDAIVREGIATRDELAKVTGYGSSGEGDGTFKSVSSFTQEQGDVLNGRLTAIQIGVQTGNALRQQIVTTLGVMSGLVGGSSAAMDDMRDLMAVQNTHLEDIVSLNKKMLSDFGEKIERIAVNTQNL